MKRFLRRWKYTISAIFIIAASVAMIFFSPTRLAGELALILLVLNFLIVAPGKL